MGPIWFGRILFSANFAVTHSQSRNPLVSFLIFFLGQESSEHKRALTTVFSGTFHTRLFLVAWRCLRDNIGAESRNPWKTCYLGVTKTKIIDSTTGKPGVVKAPPSAVHRLPTTSCRLTNLGLQTVLEIDGGLNLGGGPYSYLKRKKK